MANAPTALQQTIVTNAITAQGASWWHWFPTAWLIDDPLARDVETWTTVVRTSAPTLLDAVTKWVALAAPLVDYNLEREAKAPPAQLFPASLIPSFVLVAHSTLGCVARLTRRQTLGACYSEGQPGDLTRFCGSPGRPGAPSISRRTLPACVDVYKINDAAAYPPNPERP